MQPYITRYTQVENLYYTKAWFAYTFLPIRGNYVLVLKDKGVPKSRNHINEIECFWSFAKHWLWGIPRSYFPLYLKEMEWQFNHRHENFVVYLRRLLNMNRFPLSKNKISTILIRYYLNFLLFLKIVTII